MDDADRRILRAVQKQPDLTMRELGEITGLSHTPCWRRLKKLQDEGHIVGRRYILDAQKLGFEVIAFCFVRLNAHSRDTLEQFEKAVRNVPEVVQCYSTTGDHDYILKVLARNVRDYEKTIKHKILQLPHVSFISTSLSLSEVKNTLDVPV